MAKNKRKTAKKASTSLLMLLIIASAILAFVPFRVTLATGTTGAIDPTTLGDLQQLVGSHIAIDSLGLFTQTSTLNGLLAGLVGNATFTPAYQSALATVDYFAMKAQKITVDIDQASGTMGGLLSPFGSGPTLGASSAATIQLRLVLLSVTISGYKLAGSATNVYGEVSLTGLNAALIISLDRAFIDLFVDPLSGIGTYLVQADMTVYQGLALLLEASTL